jgi:hypothetical protein
MFDGDKPPTPPKLAKHGTEDSLESSRSGALLMKELVSLLATRSQADRNLILFLAIFQKARPREGGKETRFERCCLGLCIRFSAQLMEVASLLHRSDRRSKYPSQEAMRQTIMGCGHVGYLVWNTASTL